MKHNSSLKLMIKETDWVLYLLCILASIYGVLMVYSATYRLKGDSLIASDCIMTVVGSVLGIGLCFVVSHIDFEILMRLAPIIAGVSVLLMCSLFIFGESPSGRDDAICWLYFRIGSRKISFQPSELVKIGFVITFSTHIDAVKDNINSIKNIILLCVHGMIPIGLVILTGDLGSALVFIFIFVIMMFLGGVQLRYFAIAVVAAVIALPVLWIKFFSQFQKDRLLAVYYPAALSDDSYAKIIYQQARGLRTIGSGMFFGQGFLKGTLTQSGYVPINESDMIFTVVGEELGFIGCILLLALLAAIVIRLFHNGQKSGNPGGYLICTGIATMIAAQTIINVGVNLVLLPCIGITLPFMSAGGSSSLCVYIGIGVALSVYRNTCAREPVNFRVRNISTPFKET